MRLKSTAPRTKKFEELAQARNRADGTVHAMRKQLSEAGAAVAASDKERVEKALAELELAIRGDDKDKIESAEKAVLEAGQALIRCSGPGPGSGFTG